ncbi:hypothetical protein D3C85_1946300 [compost metagenome]
MLSSSRSMSKKKSVASEISTHGSAKRHQRRASSGRSGAVSGSRSMELTTKPKCTSAMAT